MNLLIIGNGFDLDLGRKTRYSDFRSSRFWPFNSLDHNGLGYYIENFAKSNSNWFDIEELLRAYGDVNGNEHKKTESSLKPISLKQDQLDFLFLNKRMSKYIESINLTSINTDSAAARILNAVLRNGKYNIYSFNYSSLKDIARLTGFKHHFEHEHIHGLAANKSAILGVDDETELREGYDFLYKTFSRHYKSHPIQYDLLDAEEIIFFGLSLGRIDYPYFQDFFRLLCESSNKFRENARKVTFITYDDNSRRQILRQLREMNHRRTNYLFGLNNVDFICTSAGEPKINLRKIDSLINYLIDTQSELMNR